MSANQASDARSGPALLEAGFRPFFLLGSLYAVVSMAAWLLVFTGLAAQPARWSDPWPGPYWHGHEKRVH